jgi:CRISPR-associated protein Cas2
MARRRYLIAYDISDPVRLRRVCTAMEDHGQRLQYSVFLCDLSVAELAELEARVASIIDLQADSIVRLDLGPLMAATPIHCIGRPRRLPTDGGPHIV